MTDEPKKQRRQPVETARPKTRAYVVHPVSRGDAAAMERAQARLDEAVGLAAAIELTVLGKEVVRISKLVPATYIGKGAVLRIAEAVKANEVGLVVFDCAISPTQQRNLEKAWSCKVIDRTALILEIFGARARTSEGRLQVELAHLSYQRSRLVRSWTHLERQRGGLGKTGGPGEKQIELDRRMIGERVKMLRRKLGELRDRRGVQRRARARRDVPAVSIVGYTNAGKSTLFNALTHAKGYAADRLFATLDTTTRRIWLPEAGNVTVSDTVGFVRDLPHELVAAFRATLEETVHADLLLHVVDAASGVRDRQMEEVGKVLAEIGADGLPQIVVWNKIDLVPGLEPGVERDEYGRIWRVRVSARTGAGVPALRGAIAEFAAARAAARSPAASETLSIH